MSYFSKKHALTTIIPASFMAIMMGSPAMAQDSDDSGVYVSVSGGAEFFNDGEFFGIQNPEAGVPGAAGAPAAVEVDFDTGYNIRGAIGYEFSRGFISFLKPSVELEVGYAQADVSSGAFNGGNQVFGGDIDVVTVQANYNSDIILSDNQKIIPYFGGGLGIGVVDSNIVYFPNNGVATAPTFGVFGSSTQFTTNSRIGLKARVSDNFDIFAEGRYTRTSSGDFERRFVAGGADGFSADVSGDTDTFSLGLGLRARF